MKTFFTPLTNRLGSSSKLWRTAGTLLGLLALGEPAQAQFPRIEPFNSSTATGFRIGGSAKLTGGTTDTEGNGYLRLTDAAENQAGFAIDGTSFPTPSGFSISFEFFSYGKTTPTGADGFSVFLVDADQVTTTSFTSGGSGGSLGYAQKVVLNEPDNPTNSKGVPFGYIGIGIDEFGNFSNPTEGRVSGRTTGAGITMDGRTPNSISVRGAGNGNSSTDYPYLAGTGVLPFTLDVGTTVRAQNGSSAYRRAFIDAIPQPDQTYLITVRIQYGNQVYTAINNLRVPKAPDDLRIGFAGSTGGSTNIHEIRSLAVVKGPFANDDVAGTRYDQPVTLNAISNDIFPGSQFQAGSLDLDVQQAGPQDELTIAGKGTFKADADGQVTFTPLSTFAGVVTVPYTVRDILYSPTNPTESSPALITIIVNGADVATSVSGPTSANPGSKITYTVSTSNLGTETATSIVPTIQLPSGLSGVVVSSGSYNTGSGLVTFGTIASLAANATPISNTVTFTVPTSGPLTGTATYQLPPGVPDPVVANNTATITTTIAGPANIATACATPGKDGPGTLSSSLAPNTYYPGVGFAAINTSTVRIGAARTGAGTAANAVAAGDLVLIMQMQGADIAITNNSTYGTVANNTNYTAGKYEYAIVQSVAAGTGAQQVLTLAKALTNAYSTEAATSTAGQRRFQVIRVPQYSSLALSGAVTGAAWDGNTGGVLAVDVAGRTTYATGTSLTMTAKGFRGGGGFLATSATTTAFASVSTAGNGSKAEGSAGTPARIYNGATVEDTGSDYPVGSHAAGAPGNAGGGATDFAANNTGNSGGGGGANGGTGGIGGYGYNSGGTGTQALGGRDISADASASRLFMGGGGGAGSATTGDNALNSSGGVGGGIIILRSALIATASDATGNLTIQANGGSAPTAGSIVNTTTNLHGAGGGGAGGTVIVMTIPPNNATPNLANVAINVNGGAGGNAGITNTGDGTSTVILGHGPGGGGGGGGYYANAAVSNTSTVAGGASGNTQNANGTTTPPLTPYGAVAGNPGVASTTTPPTTTATIAGTGVCLPVLTASLVTSTPNVTRNGTGVNPATYTLTVSNTGGIATGVNAQTSLATNIFGYDNSAAPVAILTLADGSSEPVTVSPLPANGTSTPAFNNFTIPAGARLSITFQASIASTAVNNFAYQANASITYSNPLRDATAATATVAPGGNYAGGSIQTLGAAGGSSYTASASTAEDVTIVRPLPVELKSFTVAAARLDAKLTWETASELNNDRFVVERSIDGLTFAPIGSVQGKGTSHKLSTYSFNDAGIGRTQAQVFYRLKQLDLDGTATFSPVRVVEFVSSAIKTDVSVYPNPTQGGATLDLTGLPAGDYQVVLLDLTGRTLSQLTLTGQREHALPVQALPQGSYIVRVRGNAVSVALPLVRN